MDKAVFLDRDGTINRDVNFLKSFEGFEFLPSVLEALNKLSRTDYKIIVFTNQSGVGRGYFSEETLKKINDRMCRGVAEHGGRIDAVYYCPHLPGAGCKCRKPGTGMVEQAQKDFNLDLKASFVIGDSTRDIQTGHNAGCMTILVKTGKEGKDGECEITPDHQVSDLLEAADIIISSKTNYKRESEHGSRKHS